MYWKRWLLSPVLIENIHQKSNQLHTVRAQKQEKQITRSWVSWVMVPQLTITSYRQFWSETAVNPQEAHNLLCPFSLGEGVSAQTCQHDMEQLTL